MSGTAPAPRSPFRLSVENGSRRLLTRLHGLPRLLIPLATGILFAVGVLAPPAIGIAALAVILVFVGWLAYLSWPVVSTGGKLMRLLMVVLVAGLLVYRVLTG
ncbi:DUF6703 family protein [Microlunatus ginsengisoli]|uniref:Uncharacterized protein n=1 Tax=Microlunatus ginsengisoli TaxID=363863 RepID=A0ABP6ZQ73_9ACTN